MDKRVVIIGGGFGGLRAAQTLARKPGVSVTLIDRRNYHLFQPLLYQVATAGLSPAEIAAPIRTIVGLAKNIEVILGSVSGIDTQKNTVTAEGRTIQYDYLIVAAGANHSYFGHDEWEDLAPGLKTLEQATEIRRRILIAYEKAETETDPDIQKSLLTFVIVGGGPTGVELAGAIAEISRQTLAKDFKHIDPSRARVILIEAGPRILAGFHATLSTRAMRDLENMGVQVWVSTRVTDVIGDKVCLGHETLKARTIVWAAGVAPSGLGKMLNSELDRIGRVIVTDKLHLPNQKNVFVIGDMAHFPTSDGKGLPGLAPVAMQEGKHAAKNILRAIQGLELLPFTYVDKGMMATIGRKKAIMEFKGVRASGLIAWLAWLFVHIFYLIGFKNKLFVFLEWCWAYFSFRKGARLIVDKEWHSTSSTAQSLSHE